MQGRKVLPSEWINVSLSYNVYMLEPEYCIHWLQSRVVWELKPQNEFIIQQPTLLLYVKKSYDIDDGSLILNTALGKI